MRRILLSILALSTLTSAVTTEMVTSIITSPTITEISTISSTASQLPRASECDPTPYAHCPPLPPPSNIITQTPHFGPTSPATLRVDAGALSAALAALSSVTATWTNGPLYGGLKSAVYEAAPTPAQHSLAISGYDWEAIVKAPWYTSIPAQWQDVITRQEQALQVAYDNVTREHLVVISSGTRRMGVGMGVVLIVFVGMMGFLCC